MADRYTYIPLIGIFLIAAWGSVGLARWWHPRIITVSWCVVLIACALMSWVQLSYWGNSVVLWERALEVAPGPLAHLELAGALWRAGKHEDALVHYRKCVELDPSFARGRLNLGRAHLQLGNRGDAIPQLRKAIELSPDLAVTYENLGRALAQESDWQAAADAFRDGLKREDGNGAQAQAAAHFRLGWALEHLAMNEQARQEYEEGMRLSPGWTSTAVQAAWLYAKHPSVAGDRWLAVEYAEQAVGATRAAVPEALDALGAACARVKRWDDALTAAKKALELAKARGDNKLADEIQSRIKLYLERKPYRDDDQPDG
jgi:tetratricopeptide (TPR) repeat protein